MCMERNTKYLRKFQSICDSSLEEKHADLQNTVYAGLREDTTRVCSGESDVAYLIEVQQLE